MIFTHQRWVFFLLLIPLPHGCSTEHGKNIHPNILWITCEDINPMLGSYHDKVAITPTLDSLAAQGQRYTNAYATAPVCSPSRSCLITGVHATSLGTQHLRSEVEIPDEIIPFPKFLREQGYYCTNNAKEDYNFSDTTIWNESGKNAHWRNKNPGQPFFSVFNIGLTHQSQIFGSDSVFHQKYGRKLTPDEKTRPEDVLLPPYYPDSPVIRKLWARYYDLVTLMDKRVATILQELEAGGYADNTVIFFYSDHGIGLPRGKRALYDFGLQVPLIIKAPEKYHSQLNISMDIESNQLISFADFAPTVLQMLNMETPDYMQGNPFLGERNYENEYIYATSDRVDEAFEMSRAVISKRFKYIRNYMPHLPLLQPNFYTEQSEIMRELYRISESPELNEVQKTLFDEKRAPEELYDLKKDPHEINNLAADPAYQDTLYHLRQKHLSWIKKTYDTGFMPEALMHLLSDTTTPYKLARNSSIYPLETILEAANLMLNPEEMDKHLSSYLTDNNMFVRYWALNNLRFYPAKAANYAAEVKSMLNDQNPIVRIAAAELMAKTGNGEQGLPVILEGLKNDNEMVLLYAARTYQLLGEISAPIENEVNEIRKRLNIQVQDKWYGYDLYASWALNEAFKDKSL